jgi:hypothetical protein
MKPARFQIYEDLAGDHYILIDCTRVTGVWLALKLQGLKLCFLSPVNLQHLTYIGFLSFA